MRFRPGDDVRVLWLLVLSVLVGGSCFVQTRYQTAIAASHDRTETLYRQTVADAHVIREAGRLRAVQRRARADLARVSRDRSLSEATARLLATLHASARTYNMRVMSLQPGGGQGELTNKALQATALTIRVRGKFRDILAFVEDLSHHSTLINVSDTEMAVANDEANDSAEPPLDATIHATMYRLHVPGEKEHRDASAG